MASGKPKKFFKNEERSAIRKMNSQSLSALYKSWGTQKKSQLKGKNGSSKNKKNPSSDVKLMPPLRTNLSPTPPIQDIEPGSYSLSSSRWIDNNLTYSIR